MIAESDGGNLSVPARASKVNVSVCPEGVRTLTFNSAGIVTVRISVVVVGCVSQREPGFFVQSQVSAPLVGSGRVKIT